MNYELNSEIAFATDIYILPPHPPHPHTLSQVTEVTWAEVQRESFGGANSNTSAYCLLYISEDTQQQWSHHGEGGGW